MDHRETWTLNKALAQGKEPDPGILESIYKNPVVRDLPKLAAMYGLYGRFVVSNDLSYFVCGSDQRVVQGNFISARDTVIPEYLVETCGYFLREDVHCGLLNLRCVVISLDDHSSLFHGQVTGMHPAASLFATLETYCHLYREHGLDIPEFVFSDRHTLTELQTCRQVLTSRKTLSGFERSDWRKREEQLLLDHAVWHWPIRKREDAGFSAFTACSRYALDTSSLSKAQRHYHHPEKWEKLFRNGKFDHNLFNETHDEQQTAFIQSGLDRMGIPYKTDVYDKRFLRLRRQETLALNQASGYQDIPAPTRTISLHRFDMGALSFLLTEYLRSRFSKKEHEIGKSLYYGIDDRENLEARMSSSYLFFIDAAFLDDFRLFADENRIRWGFPSDIADGYEADKGCFLIAEFSAIDRIRTFLHQKIHRDFSTHAVNSTGQSGYEVRTYDRNGISAWTMTPGVLKLGEADNPVILRDIPWCIPLRELEEKGFIISTEGSCITK